MSDLKSIDAMSRAEMAAELAILRGNSVTVARVADDFVTAVASIQTATRAIVDAAPDGPIKATFAEVFTPFIGALARCVSELCALTGEPADNRSGGQNASQHN